MQTEALRMEEVLARRLAAGADAQAIAVAGCDIWRRAAAALMPVIGQEGVAALFRRGFTLQGRTHPALAGTDAALAGPPDFSALSDLLAGAGAAEAVRLHVELFDAFCTLLASLIGGSLVARLLRPVWDCTSTGSIERATTRGPSS